MLLRLLLLLALIGVTTHMGPGTDGSADGRNGDEDRRMGGEGFGNVVALVGVIGVALFAILLVIVVLALTGQFDMELVDPPV